MSVREMKGQGCCGNCVNCSSPLCSVIFHIVINKIAYSLSIRLSSSSYVAFHLSLHQPLCHYDTTNWFCYSRNVDYPILFGHENILHQNASMVIVTIKARNGWLYERFGGHLLLMTPTKQNK